MAKRRDCAPALAIMAGVVLGILLFPYVKSAACAAVAAWEAVDIDAEWADIHEEGVQ